MSGPGAPADPNAARYDRQLRLWGANGQRALMEARVLVLGASATAAETLKNLVLPGIGHFTIVDGATVTRRDLGNNFFLIEEHVGQPRAAAMTQMLLEMNDDVRGEAKVVDPAQLLAAEPDFLSRGWDLVVATQMDGTTLASVAAKAWDAEVPLMILRSIGLLGYLRLQLRRHEVVEAKPDAKHWDLRLADKWPELDEFCRSFDMGGLDDRAHRHVPFVVILSQRMEAWRAAHGGRAPKSMAEKNDFKASVKAASRYFADELNFQEAVSNSYMAYADSAVGYEVAEMAAGARKNPPTNADASNFSFLVAALGDFIENEGNGKYGPLAGPLPDMTSDTEPYVKLQTIYKRKAERDMAALADHLSQRLAAAGKPAHTVPLEELAIFCKNIRNLQIVSTSSYAAEMAPGATVHHEAVMMGSLEPASPPAQTPVFWYLALRALNDAQLGGGEPTAEEVWRRLSEAKEALQSNGMDLSALTEAHAQEMLRFYGLEPHVTAAIMGGAASQEAVKIITKQYVVLNSTLIYNGVASTMSVLEV